MMITATGQCPVRVLETLPTTCSSMFSSTGKTQCCDPLLYQLIQEEKLTWTHLYSLSACGMYYTTKSDNKTSNEKTSYILPVCLGVRSESDKKDIDVRCFKHFRFFCSSVTFLQNWIHQLFSSSAAYKSGKYDFSFFFFPTGRRQWMWRVSISTRRNSPFSGSRLLFSSTARKLVSGHNIQLK